MKNKEYFNNHLTELFEYLKEWVEEDHITGYVKTVSSMSILRMENIISIQEYKEIASLYDKKFQRTIIELEQGTVLARIPYNEFREIWLDYANQFGVGLVDRTKYPKNESFTLDQLKRNL